MNHSFHLKHKWVSTSLQQQRKWDPPEESKSDSDKKGPNTYWLKQYEISCVFLRDFFFFFAGLLVFMSYFVMSKEYYFFNVQSAIKIVTLVSAVPILPPYFEVIAHFLSCITTCNINCQAQIRHLLFVSPDNLIHCHFLRMLQLGQVELGCVAVAAGQGFVAVLLGLIYTDYWDGQTWPCSFCYLRWYMQNRVRSTW